MPASNPVDHAAYAAWAARHRLAPYSYHLARLVAPELARALRVDRLREATRSLLGDQHLRELLGALVSAGVVPILFKGAGVAHIYYPSSELRSLGDVDLLFRPDHARRAYDLALSLGYRPCHSDPAIQKFFWEAHYNVPLIHDRHGVLELHHRLYRDCNPAFVHGLVDRAEPVQILGQHVHVVQLPDLFLCLAVHFGISSPGSCWVWLLDLALLGKRLDANGWAQVASEARMHGLQIFVVAVLRCLEDLWAVRFPDAPSREISRTLTFLERKALEPLGAIRSGGRLSGDRLSMSRRLSGRPVFGALGPLSSLFCDPGAVSLELGVPSSSNWFWFHRLRHAFRRLVRAVHSV